MGIISVSPAKCRRTYEAPSVNMYLSQACKPRQSVFDKSRRDLVLNISDLLQDRIELDKADRFFDENYITAERTYSKDRSDPR